MEVEKDIGAGDGVGACSGGDATAEKALGKDDCNRVAHHRRGPMSDKLMSRKLTEIHAWAREHATELRSRNGVRLRMKLSKRAVEPERRFRVWLYNHRKRIEATPQLAALLSAIEALIAGAPSNPDAPLQPGVSVSFPGITIRWPFSLNL